MNSTKTPVAADLKAAFTAACEGSSNARYLQVQIRDDELVLAAKGEIQGRAAQDFDAMAKELVKDTEAAFFLYRLDSSGKRWLFVSYVPDAAAVKEKMVYASASATLKRELGDSLFTTEMGCSEPSEVTYANYQGGSNPGKPAELPWSREELVRKEAVDAEETARKEQVGRLGEKLQGAGIGGFHVVDYPLADDAKEALSELAAGSVNWVRLSVDAQNSKVLLEESKTLSGAPSESVDAVMPAFYFYRDSTDSLFYIYSCPDKSPPKFRMVYSTCKPSVFANAKAAGVNTKYKLEIRGPDDLTSDALREAKNPRTHDWSASSSRSASREGSARGQAPPAFSVNPFAGEPGHSSSGRKKVVIPPSGAYC